MIVRPELGRPRAVAAAAALVLAAGGAAAFAGPAAWDRRLALLAVAAAGVVLVRLSMRRLGDIGRAPYGMLWTSLPLVEAAVVPFLPLHGWIPLAVCTCFAVWGTTGMNWLLAARKTDIVKDGDEGEWTEKRIRRGGETE